MANNDIFARKKEKGVSLNFPKKWKLKVSRIIKNKNK
jgi:hypothetical protein